VRVRRAALILSLLLSALGLPRVARADCDAAACVDAEPMWLTPSARHFSFVSDTAALRAGDVSGALTFGFRFEPGVLTMPSPNRDGREVNALRHATDATLGLRAGIGTGLELTLVLPAGLYQRGAGIKGVTHQAAPPIPQQSLHDPRIGFAVAIPGRARDYGGKLKLELKLPLGNREALAGEADAVLSPGLVWSLRHARWFAGGELGARFRTPTRLFGTRIGTQEVLAVGGGYELPRPHLTFAIEAYAAPSLLRRPHGELPYIPAEWLTSVRFGPHALPHWSVGAAFGTGVPLAQDRDDGPAFLAFGVPRFRSLLFLRFLPEEQ
jgi:hypothetical protein